MDTAQIPCKVPFEMIEMVLDFLHDDHMALACCSLALVCRSWTNSSRFHQFHEVEAERSQLFTSFKQLVLASTTISMSIRELRLLDCGLPPHPVSPEDLSSLLDKLSKLHTLRLWGLTLTCPQEPGFRWDFAKLRVLEISGLTTAGSGLIRVMSLFRGFSLDRLRMEDVDVRNHVGPLAR